MRTVVATRYVTPLREGGSLPGLVEADDDGLYVVKFRGAGQGPRALVAEWLAGELARAIGLTVPDLVGDRDRPGARRRRARRGDPRPGRQERRPELRDGLPARGADVQPGRGDGARGDRPRLRGRRGLARRARHQPRPLGAEPEPARLARPAMADRPRRRALHPPHLARPGRARPAAVRADRPARPPAVRGLDRDRRRAPRVTDRRADADRPRRRAPGRVAARRSGGRRRRRRSAGPTSAI